MENYNTVVDDLKGLLNIINDGKQGYEAAAEAIEKPSLKAQFLKFAAQRAGYAQEFKAHILKHDGISENEDGGILGVLHRTWIDIKQALSSKEEEAILSAIETGENAALAKYDKALGDYAHDADHLALLKEHRDGILNALKEIEVLHQSLKY